MPPILKLTLDFGSAALHHIGARFVTQEHGARLPENDTIISAAAVAWKNVTGDFPNEWFAPDSTAVACSGLLPLLCDASDTDHLYLPVPAKAIEIDPDNQLHVIKVVNKIKWLRSDIWDKWASGEQMAQKVLCEYFREFEKTNGTPKPAPVALSEFDGRWVKKTVQERVLLHPGMLASRVSEPGEVPRVSMPYRVASFRFANNAKAALIVDAGQHTENFLKAVKLLGMTGIGGDRTYGYGRFDFEPHKSEHVSEFKLPEVEGANTALTLGLLYPGYPAESELMNALQHKNSRWTPLSRQGRNTVPGTSQAVVSKRVRMADKGALLAGLHSGSHGCAVNVFPEGFRPEEQTGGIPLENDQKCIWRSGRTIALPVKLPLDGTDGGAR